MRHALRPLLAAAASIVAAAGAAAPPAAAPAVPNEDRPIAFALKLERGGAPVHVQGDARLDHPIGDGFTLGGERIAAHVDGAKLELDLERSGAFKSVKPGIVSIALGKADDKKRDKLDVLIARDGDAWTYRVISQLAGQIGDLRVAIVDVDGDGAFDHAGVDAMALGDAPYAFPLPGPDERWATTKYELTGLAFGPRGGDAKLSGRPLATTLSETLPLLKDIIGERIKWGLVPRGENAGLSAPLQKHCHYMVGTGVLAHPEKPDTAGYSPEGNEAGMNSILGMGTPSDRLAETMVATFYHRQDVVRPATRGFGVGYEGKFGGIDGRRDLGGSASWPIIVPPPDARDVPVRFNQESPDPIAGDKDAGFPITVYFDHDATITSAKLEMVDKSGVHVVDCYLLDAKQGGEVGFNHYQHVVGMIAKDPLATATQYQVTMTLDAGGTPWTKTWRFSTVGFKPAK